MPTDIMTVKWGRTDCATSPDTDDEHEFPEPTMTRDEMMTYFSDHYGYTEDEVRAFSANQKKTNNLVHSI